MAKIQYLFGNIFEAKAQVIVNTVNCQGIMGKGLALAFKEHYPDMFPVYQQECREKKIRIGRPTLYKKSRPWILNFPTKDSWRANSKKEYIEKGLEYFVANYQKAGITSIAFPKLGTQNGKLSWDEVGPLMAHYLSQLDIDITIYITEEDKQYQSIQDVEDIKAKIWALFSDLAHSQDQLQQIISINARDAKKITEKRAAKEFTSFSDIESIEGLAKTSLKKIKQHIASQQVTVVELSGMPPSPAHSVQNKKQPSGAPLRPRQKKPDSTHAGSLEGILFTTDLVGAHNL